MLYDRDIREPLFFFLEETYGKIRILEEKNTGPARADAVMVTERALCGIEIKSDADDYARLPGQVEAYDRYYDFNMAVIGLSHVRHIEEHLPPHWGIITAERDGETLDFYMMRRPSPNPNAELACKLSLLWRPEMAHILEVCHLPTLKTCSKLRVTQRIQEWIPKELLDKLISDELFERDYTLIASQIAAYRKEQGQKPKTRRRTARRRKKP